MKATALCVSLAVASFPLAAAHASGEPRIVLVAPAKDAGIAVRIRAELEALHFEVLDVAMGAEPPAREPLEDAARKSDAVAAVRIVPSSAGVEVWIVDRMTGKTVLRELVAEDEPPHGGSATIALRVMELLRASLMELDAPRPPPGEVAPPPIIREILAPRRAEEPHAAVPDKRPFLTLELGPSMLMSPGGIGPSGLLHTSAHIQRPSERFGMSAFVSIPVVPANLVGPEGTATARFGLLGVGLRGSFAPRGAAWNVNVGAGLSAVLLHFEGRPERPYAGASETLFTFAPYLRAGLGYAVTPHLRIRADALTGVTVQRPVVKFSGRVAATWGLPFISPSLGAELSWD